MKRCFFYQFSRVKWYMIRDFFNLVDCKHNFQIASKKDLLGFDIKPSDSLYFWGKKIDNDIMEWCLSIGVSIFIIEDGLIRSIGLGSALSRPLSLAMDSRGIYFDPTGPSDLEWLLENHVFDEAELEQAEKLLTMITDLKLSKYNHQLEMPDIQFCARPGQTIILVPGQVDDDMSVKFGGFGLTNMRLLEEVRDANPDAYIVYKPHPDVLSKNRVGDVDDSIPLQWADQVIKKAGIDSVLAQVDEVHTITSQVGFDGLLRQKRVYTYGLPFYAGWGLTVDQRQSERRTRKRTLNELVAASLLLYPIYMHPETRKACTAFEAMQWLAEQKDLLSKSLFKRTWLNAKGLILPSIRNGLKKFR